MNKTVQSWIERSTYDLDTAKSLLESGRYLYVLFCCQQAIEKALKSFIQSRYPEEIRELGARINRKMASDILAQTEENV